MWRNSLSCVTRQMIRVYSSILLRGIDRTLRNDGRLSEASGSCFCRVGGLCCGAAIGAFPTVRYLRIFSRRFGPSPRIASKSSTLLNAPYDLRICKIFSAVAGPIPGTCCNSSDVAALMFSGFNGGFFFPPKTASEQNKLMKRKRRENRNRKDRHAMAEL
jgi:hypothetical protein